jgi:hypothetical protein
VRSAIMTTFDTRTLAGRHIVFDHMLRDVAPWFSADARYHQFLVDAAGILRRAPSRRRSRRRWHCSPRDAELSAWLAGRLVGSRGEQLYWFVPVRAREQGPTPPRFRQDRQLGAHERAFFGRLSPTR